MARRDVCLPQVVWWYHMEYTVNFGQVWVFGEVKIPWSESFFSTFLLSRNKFEGLIYITHTALVRNRYALFDFHNIFWHHRLSLPSDVWIVLTMCCLSYFISTVFQFELTFGISCKFDVSLCCVPKSLFGKLVFKWCYVLRTYKWIFEKQVE